MTITIKKNRLVINLMLSLFFTVAWGGNSLALAASEVALSRQQQVIKQWQRKSDDYFSQLKQQHNSALQAMLLIKNESSIANLQWAIGQLVENSHTQQVTHALLPLIYAGYGQLFLARQLLEKKNYFRSAEAAKQGFYWLDQAAETDENNWPLRYLRLRMDAFVPVSDGRCVIALRDSQFLQQDKAVPSQLTPLILFMHIKALLACNQPDKAEMNRIQLEQQGLLGHYLNQQITQQSAPFWFPVEIERVLKPILSQIS